MVVKMGNVERMGETTTTGPLLSAEYIQRIPIAVQTPVATAHLKPAKGMVMEERAVRWRNIRKEQKKETVNDIRHAKKGLGSRDRPNFPTTWFPARREAAPIGKRRIGKVQFLSKPLRFQISKTIPTTVPMIPSSNCMVRVSPSRNNTAPAVAISGVVEAIIADMVGPRRFVASNPRYMEKRG